MGHNNSMHGKPDQETANAFATSWNNLPQGSVYTREQVEDWLYPLLPEDFSGKRVLEMGCGNGSQMLHVINWAPAEMVGIDLGPSVISAQINMGRTGRSNWRVVQEDLTTFTSEGYDIVFSVGVLHHLKNPRDGFSAVLRNTRPGGRFHCWVYAKEGNALVRLVVEPIRKITSRLPWWITKYLFATTLVVPYFIYAKALAHLPALPFLRKLPLYEYSLWIAKREFAFFRHVAFDQLVTPQTTYIDQQTINRWLEEEKERIDPSSTYVLMRNGNSWRFGGKVRFA